MEGLIALAVLVAGALFVWAVIRADEHDEQAHKRQLARIVGTPEWFAAQREADCDSGL